MAISAEFIFPVVAWNFTRKASSHNKGFHGRKTKFSIISFEGYHFPTTSAPHFSLYENHRRLSFSSVDVVKIRFVLDFVLGRNLNSRVIYEELIIMTYRESEAYIIALLAGWWKGGRGNQSPSIVVMHYSSNYPCDSISELPRVTSLTPRLREFLYR